LALWRGFLVSPSPLSRRLIGLFFAMLPLPVRRPALRVADALVYVNWRRFLRRVWRSQFVGGLLQIAFGLALFGLLQSVLWLLA
jgi:hypothetical protein